MLTPEQERRYYTIKAKLNRKELVPIDDLKWFNAVSQIKRNRRYDQIQINKKRTCDTVLHGFKNVYR